MNALCLGVDANGKKIIKFLGHPVNDNQKTVYYRGKDYPIDMLIKIPCGKCVGCRLPVNATPRSRLVLQRNCSIMIRPISVPLPMMMTMYHVLIIQTRRPERPSLL